MACSVLSHVSSHPSLKMQCQPFMICRSSGGSKPLISLKSRRRLRRLRLREHHQRFVRREQRPVSGSASRRMDRRHGRSEEEEEEEEEEASLFKHSQVRFIANSVNEEEKEEGPTGPFSVPHAAFYQVRTERLSLSVRWAKTDSILQRKETEGVSDSLKGAKGGFRTN